MSSLITELAVGNGLVLLSAIVLPLVARKTRGDSRVWHSETVSTLWALFLTGALGLAVIQLLAAVGAFSGILRYGYVGAEIAACAVTFRMSWMFFGPGVAARGKFRFPGGPVAHH
ncbi:hypothetical protein [Nisaea sediminum]|uniref:hypothetical protein n=1 Tax=Nisaea sediminum TaxID=2775867 RepID=UPI0018691E0A|nr:hypothetical protein [Nisaea sediminum]